jgi:hypothetical protein
MKKLTVIFFLFMSAFCYSQDLDEPSVLVPGELIFSDQFHLDKMSDGASEMDNLEMYSKLSTLHAVFGYAAVLTGLATGVFRPSVAGEDVHAALGYTAAGLSAATLGLGYAAHRNDVSVKDGLSSNLVHAALGITGGAMMVAAPFLAPSDAHKAVGMGGVFFMGLSILGKWVY